MALRAAWLLLMLGCGHPAAPSTASTRAKVPNHASSSSSQSHEVMLQEEDIFAQSSLVFHARPDQGFRRVSELTLSATISCRDCAHPRIVDVPTFVGNDQIAKIWDVYLPEFQKGLEASPFFARLGEIRETDEACFERNRGASSVLGAPYFEDAMYCVRAFRNAVTEAEGSLPGVRVRLILMLSVARNSHQLYREPTDDELARYQEQLLSLYETSVRRSCGKLRGAMRNSVCDVR